jgi:hypothetical protein
MDDEVLLITIEFCRPGRLPCSSTGTLESLAWPPAEKDLVRSVQVYARAARYLPCCSASFVLNTIVFVCILRATTMLRSTPLQRWKYGIDQFGFAYNMSLPTSFYWTEGCSCFDLLNWLDASSVEMALEHQFLCTNWSDLIRQPNLILVHLVKQATHTCIWFRLETQWPTP